MKYFVDGSGVYLGAFNGVEPPAGAVEVPTAPEDVRQVWSGSAWGAIPVSIPTEASPRQVRLALTQAGLRDTVENYVASASQDIKDTWEFATTIERNNGLITAAAPTLGITDEQLDQLFTLAVTL